MSKPSWQIPSLLGLLLSFFLFSCTVPYPLMQLMPDGLVKPIRWNGIVLGQTGFDEMLGELSQLTVVETETIVQVDQPYLIFDRRLVFGLEQSEKGFLSQPSETFGNALFIDDKIASLEFQGKLDATLADLITAFGLPDYVHTHRDPGGYIIVLSFTDWDSVGFVRVEYQNQIEQLSPESPVFAIAYYASSLELELLEAGYLLRSYGWLGYGPINALYRPIER